ncbi:hypothetical protein CFOL_v3_23074, partial [Cephalotus follicularis]
SCKPTDSSDEVDHRHCDEGGDSVDNERYQILIGRLIYLSHTRPDIAYAVGIVSQFMHDPRTLHLEAVYRILRYLKSAPGKGIMFSQYGMEILTEAYTDADWAGSKVGRRSTSRYCTFGWQSSYLEKQKQTVMSRYSAKAEYRAMAQGVCEFIWLKRLLNDLGITHESSIRLFCDNKAAVNIVHNPVQHNKTKNIKIDRFFIIEKLDQNVICTPFVKSKDQLADVLRKALDSTAFHPLVCKLGMRDIHAPT